MQASGSRNLKKGKDAVEISQEQRSAYLFTRLGQCVYKSRYKESSMVLFSSFRRVSIVICSME
jgi:hypothetical protein